MDKKRSFNFNSYEESILINLVRKYKEQIICKKNDGNTNKTKGLAWELVAKEYNELCGYNNLRDAKVLRNKFENLKKRTKKLFRGDRLCNNGECTDKSNEITSVHYEINEICNSTNADELTNFDNESDGIYIKNEVFENESEMSEENLDNEIPNLNIPSSSTPIPIKEVSYPPKNDLSNPVDKFPKEGISTAIKNPFTNTDIFHKSLSQKLSASKLELLELQKKFYLEEHTLKLKHLQESHNLSLKLQEKESAEKIKLLHEEHQIKMELIRSD